MIHNGEGCALATLPYFAAKDLQCFRIVRLFDDLVVGNGLPRCDVVREHLVQQTSGAFPDVRWWHMVTFDHIRKAHRADAYVPRPVHHHLRSRLGLFIQRTPLSRIY